MKLAFIDIETTGLNPQWHEIWEFACVYEDGTEHQFFIKPAHLGRADEMALQIGRYHERFPRAGGRGYAVHAPTMIADLLHNCVVVASNPSFDMAFINKYLRDHEQAPTWHYRVLDIQSIWLGTTIMQDVDDEPDIPWKSGRPFRGIESPPDERHTALGDARSNKRLWDSLTGRTGEEGERK